MSIAPPAPATGSVTSNRPFIGGIHLRTLAFIGVCLVILTTPWRGSIQLPGIGTISRAVGLIVFPLALVAVLGRRRVRPPAQVHVVILAFAAWAALSYFWSIDQDTTFREVVTVVQLLGLVWLVWEFADTRAHVLWLLSSFVAGTYAIGIAVLADYVADPGGSGRYSSAQGVQPNGVAFLLGLAIPAAWYLSFQARPVSLKILLRSYLLVAVVAELLTGSRGGLLTMVAALTIVPLSFRQLSHAGRTAVVTGLVVVSLATLAVVPTRPFQRLLTTSSELRGGDLNNRRALWDAALNAFDEHPVGGVGAGASRIAIRQATDREDGAHNTYISVAAELGVIESGGRLFEVGRGGRPAALGAGRGNHCRPCGS